MKRVLGVFILGLLLFSLTGFFVDASDVPSLPGLEENQSVIEDSTSLDNKAEETQKQIDGVLDKIPIDPSTGEFDLGKIEGLGSKSQERIDKINLWLEENMGWMEFILRMPPALSWLFFLNIYVVLFFFTLFVLNADDLFFFTSKSYVSYLSGFALFMIGLVTTAYLRIAEFLFNVLDLIINTIIPAGILAILVISVIILVLFFTIPGFASLILIGVASIAKGMGKRDAAAMALRHSRKKFKEHEEKMEAYSQGAGI